MRVGERRLGPARLHLALVGERHRPPDRLVVAHGLKRDQGADAVVAHHHLVPEPLDERPGVGGGNRRDEIHPVGREPWAQHRHRHHDPPEPAGPGVADHHVAVGDDVGASDVEGFPGGPLLLQTAHQIPEYVADRDGLAPGVHPLRGDHEGQPLHQGLDHLEGHAPRADDHRGAKLGHRHRALAKRAPGLEPAGQVPGEVRSGLPQPAEIDDAPDPGASGGLGQSPRRAPVTLLEPALPLGHGVDQVVDRVEPVQKGGQGTGVEEIPARHLHPVPPGAAGELLGASGQAAHPVALVQEPGDQAAPDVAGGPGHPDQRLRRTVRARFGHRPLTGTSPGRPGASPP